MRVASRMRPEGRMGRPTYSWTPPVGIPRPSFGVEESHLMYAGVTTSAGGLTYGHDGPDGPYTHYVDNTSGSATDSGNTYGTFTTPRLTIPSLATLPAGSVVYLAGGPYTGGTLYVGGAGTAAAPIFVRGNSTTPTNFRRYVHFDRAAAYVILENLQGTTRDAYLDIRPTSDVSIDHISVRRCEFIGTGTNSSSTSMIGVNGVIDGSEANTTYPIHDVVFYANVIRDGGNYADTEETRDVIGINVGVRQHDIWYVDNTIYHMQGDGIGAGHNANHTTYNLFIGRNTVYGNLENGVDFKEVHGVVVSSNEFYGFLDGGDSGGEAIVLHYGPTAGQGPYDVWVLNNYVHDTPIGIALSDVEASIYVVGNLFETCDEAIQLAATGGGDVYVYHNTLVDCSIGHRYAAVTDAMDVGGNLVSNATTHLTVADAAQRALMTIANELYYQGGENVSIGWGSTYTSVAAWIAASSNGADSLQADPLFVGASDYRLQTGSPCIDAGVDMSAVAAAFAASFGTSLLTDRAGTARPNGVWDIGAYERA